MPFLAKRGPDLVRPRDADRGDELRCVECEQPLSLIRGHRRNGHRVARHFRHRTAAPGCAETPLHARGKAIAADVLPRRVPGIAQARLEAPIGRRRADVRLDFTRPRHPYGRGLAIEIQVRHEAKDTARVERDYAAHGYSTLWLTPDDLTRTGLAANVLDRVVPAWPTGVPDRCPLPEAPASRGRAVARFPLFPVTGHGLLAVDRVRRALLRAWQRGHVRALHASGTASARSPRRDRDRRQRQHRRERQRRRNAYRRRSDGPWLGF